jgi:hypothetical protein
MLTINEEATGGKLGFDSEHIVIKVYKKNPDGTLDLSETIEASGAVMLTRLLNDKRGEYGSNMFGGALDLARVLNHAPKILTDSLKHLTEEIKKIDIESLLGKEKKKCDECGEEHG